MKISEIIVETAAWKKKSGKNKNGGLNKKGVASYRREHPGSKLQTAVTTKPSKLKKGSKSAKRRKSFCARMGGVKGPMKKPNGKPTRKALALRKWHCESVEQLEQLLMLAEAKIKQRLDAKCWSGKHKEGTKIKGGVRVNNCVPNESVAEGSDTFRNKIRDALWYSYQQDPMMPPKSHEHRPEDMEQDEYEDFEDTVDDILQFALAKNITNAHLAVVKYFDRPIATGDEHRTIQEDDKPSSKGFVKKFAPWVAEQLGIKLPKIVLLDRPRDTTFGQYVPDEQTIYLVIGGRHPVDVLRTLAHELTHHKQDLDDNLPAGAGETGTDQENEANANAGIMMRDFAETNPEYFGLDSSSIAEHSNYKINPNVDLQQIKFATETVEKYAQSLGMKFKFSNHFFKQVTAARGIGTITAEMILHASAKILKRGLYYFKNKPDATSLAFWDPQDDNHVILEVFKNNEDSYFVRSVVRDTKWYGDSQKIRL